MSITPPRYKDRTLKRSFVIGADWLIYAHGPGAESGQSNARTLVNYANSRGRLVHITPDREDLVREIASVAGLYVGSFGEDEEGKKRAKRAQKIVERAREWLKS